jgi:hypothetical protein
MVVAKLLRGGAKIQTGEARTGPHPRPPWPPGMAEHLIFTGLPEAKKNIGYGRRRSSLARVRIVAA